LDLTFTAMSQGEDVFPIPGTKRVKYLEQNAAAYAISKTLTKADLAELEAAVPAHEARLQPGLILRCQLETVHGV
jgi:aryl-alcohol dehydrogenase-like predicted oxidoreductase